MPVKRRLDFGQGSSSRAVRSRYFPMYRGLRSKGPVKGMTYATLTYNDSISLSPSGTSPASHYFRASSIYDPDFTSTGHQPAGYNELAALYNRYTVVRSGIRVDFISESPAAGGQLIVGVRMDSDTTIPTDPRQFMEARGTKYQLIADADAGPNVRKITCNYNAKRDFGLNPTLGASTAGNISSNFGDNPSHNKYYHVFAYVPAGFGGGTIRAVVTVYYTVLLTQPSDVALS